MEDRVFLENLRLSCRVGITSEERRKPQEVMVDVSLFLSLKPAAEGQRMDKTVNYKDARRLVLRYASKGEFKLLEALADGLAAHLLEAFDVERVTVRARKAKYSGEPSIGIEVVRDRG